MSSYELDLSKPLAAGEKRTVYVVHRGTLQDKAKTQSAIADPVCTRTTLADAQSIADLLNQALEGVHYLRFVASTGFPLACGDADAVTSKADEDSMRITWERIAGPHRKPIYTVAQLQFAEEADSREFERALEAEKLATTTTTQ